MGAHLVAQALAHWTHLSDRAFRVLVRMSLTALDNPAPGRPAGVYHGGRELLAMSLRSDKGTAETRYRSVKRAVAELTEAGAIQHLRTGWAGQNAVYRLTLQRAASIDDSQSAPEEMGGLIDPPMGGPTSPPMGGPNVPEWGASQAPPRNQEEPLKERGEEQGVDLQTTSHAPRVADEPTNPESSPRPAKCPTHGLGGGVRPDGLPECTFCRREQRTGPPEPDPPPNRPGRCDHTPLPGKDRCRICAAERIAPVIRLDSRRPA